jgi:hypothetical protein
VRDSKKENADDIKEMSFKAEEYLIVFKENVEFYDRSIE